MDTFFTFNGKIVFIFVVIFLCTSRCTSPKKYIAIDLTLKQHPLVQPYINNAKYKTEFHDTDILLQRKSLGKKYETMYLISAKKELQTMDSLTLFEIDNQNDSHIIVFPRTPSPLTLLMNTYYSTQGIKVYANTTAERLNYLRTNYAQKTWITRLDTHLCDKIWKKKLLKQKLYLIKT